MISKEQLVFLIFSFSSLLLQESHGTREKFDCFEVGNKRVNPLMLNRQIPVVGKAADSFPCTDTQTKKLTLRLLKFIALA